MSTLDTLLDELSRRQEQLAKARWAHDRGLPCPWCKEPCGGEKWENGQCLIGLIRAEEGELTRQVNDLKLKEAEDEALSQEPHVAYALPNLLKSITLTREEAFEARLGEGER